MAAREDGRGPRTRDPGPGPDFLCIGAQKAGTTWLHRTLERHSQVWMPPVKEIHYFDLVAAHEELIGVEGGKWPTGLERLSPLRRRPSWTTLRWLYRYYSGFPSTEWYLRLFDTDVSGGSVTGDITPAYSTLGERGVAYARRVLKDDCRILLIIRSPIDRFWSSIKMRYRWLGRSISSENVDRLVDEAKEPSHWLRGAYSRIIRLWKEYFGEQFQVFLFETLSEDPDRFLGDILAHLDLGKEDLRSRVSRRVNADPTRQEIPPELHGRLVELYRSEIRDVEDLVPGVADGWLQSPR